MKEKFRNFMKVSVKEKSDPKKLREEIRKIIEEFKKENIEFCVLRNYEKLENQKDLDILIKDRKNLRKVMKKFGFRKRSSYGPYTSYKRKDIWLDFKVGCIAYNGFCFENAKFILNRKKLYKYYYIPKEEDELIHLILHPILFKKYFKEKYKTKIEILLKKINKKKVVAKMEDNFPNNGKKLFFLIENKEYEKALKLRKKLFLQLFNLRDFPYFCVMILVSFYGKFVKNIL